MSALNLPPKDLPSKPITLEEVEQDAKKRLSLISQEFSAGFEFIKNYPQSVTFFGSAQITPENQYYKKARELSFKIVKELGYSIVTGGGPGIMEAANKGAYEAGGNSLGLNIRLPREQVTNPYVTKGINFYYFFSRKVCLSFAAEAYIFFPGGFGTLDEMFEILTLVQTHKIKRLPVILFGEKFWVDLEKFMVKHMLSEGLIQKEEISLYTITDDMDEIIKMIGQSTTTEGVPYAMHAHDVNEIR